MPDSATHTTMLTFPGVRPHARGEEATYFAFCQEGRLCIQRCPSCQAHVFYPRSVCPSCLRRGLEWVDAQGTGTVHTFTVQHRDPPGFEGQSPYVLAIIELAEGVRLLSRVIAPPGDVRIGMTVQVAFALIADDFRVPVFVPAEQGAGRGDG